jgi:DHA1 family bicyclomycin/chloramphenicol resistance-like MFS transporter
MTTDTDPVRTQPASPSNDIATPLLLVLGLLSAVAPFATDLYLPAFPQMTVELTTSATTVQLKLTAFLVGVTAGQLVFGPLSDRFGRVPPLIAGAALCVFASAVAVFAPNVAVLVAARLLQGLGGAAGMVIGRAVISDLSTGKAAARAFSLMMIVGGVAPVIAPLLGGLLTGPIGWRGLLAIVLGLSVAMLVAVLAVVRETHLRARRDALRAERVASGSPLRALRSRMFIGYTTVFAFGFAVMMAYISASPFLYQNMLGLDTVGYGIMFGLNALALVVVSALSPKLTAARSVESVLTWGIAIVTASTIVFALLVFSGAPAFWLAVPLLTAVGSLGLVFGNATALALGAVPRIAGSASAVLGAAQFGLAAVVSPLVSLGGEGTAAPLAVVMLASATIAVAALAVTRRAEGAAKARTTRGH